MLQDSFGRLHNYLRVSLTDSCNFRCHYCMPDEKMSFMTFQNLMTPTEIFEIVRIFVSMGVRKVRLTGGEPLTRPDFADIVEMLATLPIQMVLTTNGVLLDKYQSILKKHHVNPINISLDTLQAEKFAHITQRNHFKRVWDNINAALRAQFVVKINVVALRGFNDDEIIDFVRLTENLPLHIRFIEYMPFDKNDWQASKVVTAQEMLDTISPYYPHTKLSDDKHDTDTKYQILGAAGTFAFIPTMSQPFCSGCNRLRLTADGKIKNCLFGKDELDLLTAYRNGNSIQDIIYQSVRMKHASMGGQFKDSYIDTSAEMLQNRSMIKIGG